MTAPDPNGAPDALFAAVNWIAALLTGTLATMLATIAIAFVGLAMLGGRMAPRDGVRVVLGCFLLFGAGSLAAALTGVARDRQAIPAVAPNPMPAMAPPPARPAFDPYAGASVPG